MKKKSQNKTLCSLVHVSFFILIILIFSACQSSQPPKFIVHYIQLEDYEGDTLYLWRSADNFFSGDRDNARGALDSAIVKNGRATFIGLEDTLNFYQISGIRNEEIRFYPERGELTIYTTPIENSRAKDVHYESTNPRSMNVQLAKKHTPYGMRKMMMESISNAMGCYLLDGLVIVYPDELEQIYNRTNKELRNRSFVLQNIKKQLDETQEINIGDTYIDFKQRGLYTNDTVQFSDMVGKGKPTCLLLLQDINLKNCIRNEIERLQTEYPDIQLIIPTFYYQDPGNKDFYDELTNTYNALLLDDSYRFESSVRFLYRIRYFFNYMYLFDGNGKLQEKKPVEYKDYDAFMAIWNNLQTAWAQAPLSLSSRSSDYLAIPEFKIFKEFVLNSPEGIDLMLDFCLNYETPFGLNAFLIDDIVQMKYKEIPVLIDHIRNSTIDKNRLPEWLREYVKAIRKLERG